MKVLFVNIVYGQGSTGKIIADIMGLLKKQGNEVLALYGFGPRVDTDDAVRVSGKTGYYLHNAASRITDHAGLYSRHATRRLIAEIKSFKPDIIHLHTLHGFYVNYELLFSFLKEADIPVVWTLHDCWSFTGHCTHFSEANCAQWKTECRDCALLRRYPHCYTKGDVLNNYLRKKAAFTGLKNLTITCPSHWLSELVAQSFLGSYPRALIPNGIDRDIFHPQSSDLRTRFQLEGKKIVLGVASTWNERKGLPDLISLAERLGGDYQLVLIGLDKKQLRDVPDNMLALPRTANQKELAQWYTAADVFVNPSYEESFGLTTVEAQACGTPVVIYNTDACPETIVSGESILVKQGDVDALTLAVQSAAEKGLRVNADKTIEFDKNIIYEKYINLYDSILNSIAKSNLPNSAN